MVRYPPLPAATRWSSYDGSPGLKTKPRRSVLPLIRRLMPARPRRGDVRGESRQRGSRR